MIIRETREEAEEVARGDEVIVEVDGGWAVMSARDYIIWEEQK